MDSISLLFFSYHYIFFFFIFKASVLIFLTAASNLWDLSFMTRDETWALAVKVPSPNRCTARKFPASISIIDIGMFDYFCQFQYIVFFKKLFRFMHIIKFVETELFIIFLYFPLNAHGISGNGTFHFFLFFLIEVQLTYNIVFVSGVEHSGSFTKIIVHNKLF